jgi:hypothetical protein
MSPEPREPFPPPESRHQRRRLLLKEYAQCVKCGVREAEPLVTQCIRCQAYNAEYKWLGFSNINLAKGSDWESVGGNRRPGTYRLLLERQEEPDTWEEHRSRYDESERALRVAERFIASCRANLPPDHPRWITGIDVYGPDGRAVAIVNHVGTFFRRAEA